MSGAQARWMRKWDHFWRLRRHRADSGVTLVELLVVLLVTAIVMSLAGEFIVNVSTQSSAMLNTVKGINSQTGADLSLIQYLRASTELLGVYNSAGSQIGPSSTQLDMVINDGFNTTNAQPSNWGQTQPYQSNCTNIDVLWWVPTSPAHADAQLVVTSDIPSAGLPSTPPWSSVAANGAAPYNFSPTSPCAPTTGIRALTSYYALSSQTDPVFTYWAWSTTSTSTTSTTVAAPNIPPGLVQLPVTAGGVLPACAIPEVAAVGVHITFLAGPQIPTAGYATDQPTTLNTLVFLIGSSTSGATTTSSSTTSTTSACPE